MMSLQRLLGIALATTLIAGCSWFGGDDNEPEEVKPNPLTAINAEARLETLWSRKIGDGAGDRAVRLRPAVVGGRIFAASADGTVKALTTDTGREIWSTEIRKLFTKEELVYGFTKDLDVITGGVGANEELVVVGTGSGEIVALNQSDGTLAWRSRVSSEMLSVPAVDRELVVAQTIDGKIAAFEALDGERRWIYSNNIPALTLRGTASPMMVSDIIVGAFASGRIAFLGRDNGLAAYDQRIGVAQGNSDLERLVDIDGQMVEMDGSIFVAGFQGRVVGIELNTGRILWAEETSSIAGLGSGFGNIYLATADDQVVAYNANDGREIWRVDALLNRDITAPVAFGSYIAITDFEGYIHLLAQSDGRFVGRKKAGKGFQAGLVSSNSRLYAMDDNGSLSALEIR